MPDSIVPAIEWAIARKGVSKEEVLRVAGNTPYSWLYGQRVSPRPRKPEQLKQGLLALERRLDLSEGVLLALAYPSGITPPKHAPTPFGSKMVYLHKLHYTQRDFPARLESGFNEFKKFHTRRALRTDPRGFTPTRNKHSIWTTRNGEYPSEDVYRLAMSSFFGYLALPEHKSDVIDLLGSLGIRGTAAEAAIPSMTGEGVDPEDLDLCMLSDQGYLDRYVSFMEQRNGNSTGAVQTLRLFRSILHPEHGFLAQYPEVATSYMGWEPLNNRSSKEDFASRRAEMRAICENAHGFAGRLCDATELEGGTEKSRSPERELRAILRLPQPIEALNTMLRRMLAEEPTHMIEKNPKFYAMWLRHVLIISFLMDVPLRSINIRTLRISETDTTNLEKIKGQWHVKIVSKEMKSRLPYDVQLNARNAELLERWRSKWRGVLLGGNESDFLFPKASGKGLDTGDLMQRIKGACRRYLPEYPPFGPHAFRHIIATGYMIADPEGIATVANILGDTIETVRKYYIHNQRDQKVKKWKGLQDDLWNKPRQAA